MEIGQKRTLGYGEQAVIPGMAPQAVLPILPDMKDSQFLVDSEKYDWL